MRGIEVDSDAQTARVEAGVLSPELGEAANEHGLSSMPGSSPDVGVVGYTLGGGLSWFGRTPRLRLQPGEARSSSSPPTARRAPSTPRTTPTSSGPCAAAAAATRSSPRCTSICCRSPRPTGAPSLFPAEVGADAVRAYRDWAAEAPEEITSVVRFVTPPPIPDVPEPIRGRPLLTIDGACIGSQEEGEAAIAPLREIGEPLIGGFTQMPTAGLSHIHMDPENPVPGIGDGKTVASSPTKRSTPGSGSRESTPGRRCC